MGIMIYINTYGQCVAKNQIQTLQILENFEFLVVKMTVYKNQKEKGFLKFCQSSNIHNSKNLNEKQLEFVSYERNSQGPSSTFGQNGIWLGDEANI